jgi:hypothetical protein
MYESYVKKNMLNFGIYRIMGNSRLDKDFF